MQNILVTGGAGFIGSNFIRYLLSEKNGYAGRIINLDKLTYAGNIENLEDFTQDPRYIFEQADIADRPVIEEIFQKYEIDTVVHFAAESHVDRSILGPEEFIRTNVFGTFTLLDAARKYWKGRKDVLFQHVSTDEVYGSLGPEGYFYENSCYDPRSPYSASKAGSDHLVMAYYHTYGLPVTISNCSNNYGPYQFPEKLIPLMILNMLEDKPLPVYGKGLNVRDWLYVTDHCDGIWRVIERGIPGNKYNFGGDAEKKNIDVIHDLASVVAEFTGKRKDALLKHVTYVADRPGHDLRYAIDSSKSKRELDWHPATSFTTGLEKTVSWYLQHMEWVENIRSGEYRQWIKTNYEEREEQASI